MHHLYFSILRQKNSLVLPFFGDLPVQLTILSWLFLDFKVEVLLNGEMKLIKLNEITLYFHFVTSTHFHLDHTFSY